MNKFLLTKLSFVEYEREEDEATLHTFRSSFFVKQLRLNTGRNLEIFTTSQQHQSAAAAAKPESQFEHDE